MGARVKKTVREQLEELRSDVFEGEVEGSKLNRARKRKSNSDSQGKSESLSFCMRLSWQVCGEKSIVTSLILKWRCLNWVERTTKFTTSQHINFLFIGFTLVSHTA